MYGTGILRRIDELGRIVIPREIRRSLGITPNVQVEYFVDKVNRMVAIKPVEQPKEEMTEKVNDYFDNLSDEAKTDFILALLSRSETVTKSVVYNLIEEKF